MITPIGVWLLTNAPSPYQVELLAAIGGASEVDLAVRYMRDDHARLSPKASNIRVMSGIGPRAWRDEVRLHPLALWECASGRHDCYVLSGLWTSITFLTCALVLWLRGRPWVLWLERPHPDSLTPKPIRWLRDQLRRFLLARSSAVLCIGTAARDAYAEMGVPREKLFVLPYCCDTRRFDKADPERVATLRRRYNLTGKTVLLFSGQMIERKGIDTLIEAFKRVAQLSSDAALLLLGDGPKRAEYERMVSSGLQSSVHFTGHVPQTDLPEHFAAADIFVFPSRHDGWGVVINEACAAGLPVIATQQTGSAYDLVEDGKSGFVLDRDDVDAFADRMLRLIEEPQLRKNFGQRSRELVAPFSAENGALLFIRQLHLVLGHPSQGSAEHGARKLGAKSRQLKADA
jgi:glycosyltransferase involved in cell wall biosynthesis